jgi:DNA repair protein RadC
MGGLSHVPVILHISIEDVLVTRAIVSAGKLLDVDVLDHLVIGQGVWVSLRERGIGSDTR